MNNAILIQHCLSSNSWTRKWAGIFYDQLRLTQPRHMAYARAHSMDYWSIFGDIHPEMAMGAWGKIWLLSDALARGYEYAIWLDTDAAIMNLDCDLRDALPADKYIGVVEHNPARSAYLRTNQVPAHLNVGVLYVRNSDLTRQFLAAWLESFPGDGRWMEQGAFNDLARDPVYAPLVSAVDDTWNATVNVNPVNDPNVQGWHGVMPPEKRLEMMKNALRDDFLKFRV